MTRQVTDNLYIDLGYFTPEDYYVYEAVASASAEVIATMTADVGVIAQGASVQDSQFDLSATISHIEGVDIVLSNFASVDVTASVIREVAISIDSAFDFVSEAVAGNVRDASASFSSEFAQTASIDRLAGVSSDQSSSFEFAVDAVANRSAAITLDTIGNLLAQADRSRDYSSDLASEFTVTADSNSTLEFDAFLEYEIPDLFVDAVITAEGVISAGALFTPSITVEAFKNHTAILECTATMTVDVIKTADSTAILDSAFAQSTDVTKLVEAASTVTSEFTVTASATRTRSADAAIDAVSTFAATARRVSRPGIPFALTSAGEISSAQSKFGAGSVRLISGQTAGAVLNSQSPHIQQDLGSFNWTMDFWQRQSANAPGSYFTIFQLAPSGINIRLGYLYDGSTHVYRLQYTNHLGSTVSNDTTGTSISVPLNQWNHYRVTGQVFSSQTTNVTVWLNGSKIILSSAQYLPSATSTVSYRSWSNANYLDEIRLYEGNLTDKDTTTFTPPSAAFVNDSSTRYLLHLDTNTEDDNLLTSRLGAAALSTAVTMDVTGTEIVRVSAALASAVTQTTTAEVITDANASLAAEGFVMTTAGYLLDDVADLVSVSSLTAQVNYAADNVSTLAAEFAQLATVGYLQDSSSTLAVEFNQTANANILLGFDVSAASAFAVSAQESRLRDHSADLVSEGFVLAVGGEQQQVQADLAVVSSVIADIVVIADAVATINSDTTLTVNAGPVREASANLSSELLLTVFEDRLRLGASTLDAVFDTTADGVIVADTASSLLSEFAFTATASRTRDNPSDLDTFSTMDVQGNYVADNASTQAAVASQTAQGNYTASAEILAESVGFAISVIAKTGAGSADLYSTSTMTVVGNYITDNASTIATASSLTATGLRIFEFAVGNYNVQGVDFRSGFSPFLRGTTSSGTYGAWIMSFYAADPQGTIFDGDAYTNEPSGYSNKSTLSFVSNQIRYEVPYDGYVVWDTTGLDLSGYHHYLVRINTAESTNALKYQLFVDGEQLTVTVYKTATTAPTPPSYQVTTAATNFPIQLASTINLGINTWDRGGSEGVDFSKFSGGFTQWYFDYTNSYTSATYPTQNSDYRDQFFDGAYMDMGQDGTDSGLDSPKHFLELLDYTDSTSIPDQGTVNTSWLWKSMQDNPTIIGSNVIDYTASATDNSDQAILGPVRAKFTLTATAQIIQVISANLQSTSTLTVTARKTITGEANLDSAVTVTAVAQSTKEFITAIDSAFTVSVLAGGTVEAAADFASTTALTADVIVETGAFADFSTLATLAANAGLLAEGTVSLASESALTVNADRIKDVLMTVDSACATQANAIKTAVAEGSLANTATLSIIFDRIPAISIDLQSAFAVQTTAVKTTDTGSTQTSAFTTTPTPNKIVGVSANFTAFYTQLTVGRVISIDPFTTYVIPAETRLYQIARESRLYTVESESRNYKIRKESRLYTIDSETRIYNIKG
jgi:hypothetical protein